MSSDLEVNNESSRCWEKNSSYITTVIILCWNFKYIFFPLSISHQDKDVICLIQQERKVVRQTDSSPRLLLTLGLCPNNWIHLQGSCYRVPSKSLSWTAAKSDCEAQGAKLAIVTSQAEQQALVSEISKSVWIGLRRDHNVYSRWLWVDGSRATYTHWKHGEPNNDGGNERCTIMLYPTRKWNDLACSNRRYYLCETNGRQHHNCVLNIVLIIMVYPVYGCSWEAPQCKAWWITFTTNGWCVYKF